MSTHPYIPLTVDQVREVLTRLQWYAYHTYFVPEAVEAFAAKVIEHEGRRGSLSVRHDGKVVYTGQDGATWAYDVAVGTHVPREGTLDHLDYRFVVLDRDLNEADAAYASEMGAFLLSYVQRNLAFQFLSRMQPITIEQYATALASMVPHTPSS